MKSSLPKLALLIVFSILGAIFSPSAEAARRIFTGVPIIIITTPQPLSPH